MFHLELENESGMVMMVTLIVTLISTILAASYMSITIYESRHSVCPSLRTMNTPGRELASD